MAAREMNGASVRSYILELLGTGDAYTPRNAKSLSNFVSAAAATFPQSKLACTLDRKLLTGISQNLRSLSLKGILRHIALEMLRTTSRFSSLLRPSVKNKLGRAPSGLAGALITVGFLVDSTHCVMETSRTPKSEIRTIGRGLFRMAGRTQ